MHIIVQPSAKRDLKKLDKGIVETVLRKLNSVRDTLLKHIIRLKSSHLWKLRIEAYRAILVVNTKNQEIHVIKYATGKIFTKRNDVSSVQDDATNDNEYASSGTFAYDSNPGPRLSA